MEIGFTGITKEPMFYISDFPFYSALWGAMNAF